MDLDRARSVDDWQFDIDDLLSPVSSLICSDISTAKLNTFVVSELLIENQGVINSDLKELIIPRVDLFKSYTIAAIFLLSRIASSPAR
jgi:hypothetical protein